MKKIVYLTSILVISFFVSSVDESVYSHIESSLPTVLAAIFGGLLAATSIIIAVFLMASAKVKNKAVSNIGSFNRFVVSLRTDLIIILTCLFFSIFLPYIRNSDNSFSIDINGQNFLSLQSIVSTAEIFIFLLSFIVLYETVEVLMSVVKNVFSISKE